MPALDPTDFFALDNDLSDEERLVRDSVRSFVDAEIRPHAGRWFADQTFPKSLVPKMGELGLLGATIDGYGCAGLGKLAYGVICRELEHGDSAFRSFVSVQSSLVMECIARFGSDEQKDRYLPPLAAGELIGCFGLTESHGGSDPAQMRTTARRDGDRWTLSGSKHWITNGAIADIAVVWAATDDGIAGFLVPAGRPGFGQREIRDKLSLRASSTGELFFDAVEIADSDRLPGATGLGAALACLDQARYGIVWGAVGAAQACLEEAVAYVAERELFGRTLSSKQLIQQRLADSVRRLVTAQTLALRLARLKEGFGTDPAQVSLAKWNNVRAALAIARDCRDMLGAAGITVEHAAMRHMLNLESVATYEGTESVHTLVVGRAITGESAF
jgi:glutaryl-CoA dehydrogenase